MADIETPSAPEKGGLAFDCVSCGNGLGIDSEFEECECGQCEQYFCEDCIEEKCGKCERYFCDECIEGGDCDGCQEYFCQFCREKDMSTMCSCGRTFCDSCADELNLGINDDGEYVDDVICPECTKPDVR